MLNISIKELRKCITTEKAKADFLTKHVTITEKFDGTKLTLIRNNQPWDWTDHTRNWIVSYKGNILFHGEFSGLPWSRIDMDVRQRSIGTSQYAFVHNFLAQNQAYYKDVPLNTEYFVEFIQRKATLTRDYEEFHDLYLIGVASASYVVSGQRLFSMSSPTPMSLNLLYAHANLLKMKTPPVVAHEAVRLLGGYEGVMAKYSNMTSCLGGIAEGVVIKTTNDEVYKVVAPDQYNKEIRRAKKARWALDLVEETEYWRLMNEQSNDIFESIPIELSINSWLRELSEKIYAMKESDIKGKNTKKHLIVLQDDLFLTTKLMYERYKSVSKNSSTLGIFVMSGKPVHEGHWKMIQKAAIENDSVMVFVSVKDRKTDDTKIMGEDVLGIWKDNLMKHLPKNVTIRFSDNPYLDAVHEVRAFHENPSYSKLKFSFYTASDDVVERWGHETFIKEFSVLYNTGRVRLASVPRKSLANVSGTKMREWLKQDAKQEFMAYLPSCLDDNEKNKIWVLLSGRL